MFRHYLTIAVRNLRRDRIYSAINLLSLSLASACAIALSLYAANQLTYDEHHKNYESIVRVVNQISSSGQAASYALTSRALGPLLTKQYPQVGSFVRVRNFATRRAAFRYQDDVKYWDNVKIADENLFDVFTHETLYGNPRGALADPSSIVVSESFARSYFGDRNPVGETVSTDTFSYRIAAVIKDLPSNSHLRYDVVISMKRLRAFGLDDLASSPEQLFSIENYTYFQLKPSMDRDSFDRILAKFRDDNAAPVGNRIHTSIDFKSQPLDKIHFDTSYRYDQPTSNVFYVYGFIAVAVFLVLVACINYTNLATARAIRRSMEIGMRRVMGASQRQLIVQFLGESICLALVAALIGIGLLLIVDSTVGLGELLGAGGQLNIFQQPTMPLLILLGAVLVGILAGIYPALYLSSITAKAAITTQRNMRRSRFSLREVLVFVQFLVSIGVVASSMIMHNQLQYVANKPLGFERENRLAIPIIGVDAIEKIPVMKAELEKDSAIVGVTESSFVPGGEVAANIMKVETNEGTLQEVTLNQIMVGRDFAKVAGVEMVKGRDFSKRFLTDVGTSVMVNESLVRLMGWKDPIGKSIPPEAHVIGVVRDFHFSSLHAPVGPMVLRQFRAEDLENVPDNQRNLVSRTMIVAVDGSKVSSSLAGIRRVVSTFDAKHPVEYSFFVDLLSRQYAVEARTMRLIAIFAVVCVALSCLGLFGLAALTTEQRTKEIGVRKVLGASPMDIILMMAKELLAPVLAAALLGSWITFVIMQRWMETFVYRTEIHVGVFIAAIALIGFLAYFSVAIQGGKAALQNPVNSIRNE